MTKEPLGFDAAFEETAKEVDNSLNKAPLVVRTYTKHLAKARGKFIRTFSLLACAMDEEDKIDTDAICFASAIEILHLATLVHDDIMDNAEVRRGIETIQKKYGRKTAVICGDYLLSASLKKMLQVKNSDMYKDYSLPDFVGEVCAGELKQHINNGNLDLSMFRYLSIINGKTAALFEASFYGGAILSKADEKNQILYRRLGRYIGVIFQLTDDCIDFEEKQETALKNVQSDFEQGVITLPLIYTLQQYPELKEKAGNEEVDRQELNRWVQKSGGISFTKGIAKRYYDKASKIIEQLSLTPVKEEKLVFILNRAYYGLQVKCEL